MGGVCAMISVIGNRCSRRTAMNMRGMTGKWKAMWHSSPSPKYDTTSAGHWLASARSTAPGNSSSTVLRMRRRYSWVSRRFSQFVPSRSYR